MVVRQTLQRTILNSILILISRTVFTGCQNDPITPGSRGPKWVVFQGPGVPLLSNVVNDITVHRNGQVWVATDSGASYYYHSSWGSINDSLGYLLYSSDHPPRRSTKVNCITVGKDGSVWFGLAGGGIKRFFQNNDSRNLWSSYQSPEISFNVISSLSCEQVVNGDVWATTLGAGVNRFIPNSADPRIGRWGYYTVQNVPELKTNLVRVVRVNEKDQSTWIGTQFSLVAFFGELSGWRSFDIPAPFTSTVYSIDFDLPKNVWLGKIDGVSTYDIDKGVWEHYTSQNTGGVL